MSKKKAISSSFWHEFVPKSWLFLNRNYSLSLFKSDLIAGITVGLVALPLAMAFAIASGVPPERGLYTAIVAGFLISLLGGSRFQIGGPTGAFVVIIYGIVQRHTYEGLVFITLIAGALLLLSAFSRLGSLIKYIPYPLITGFTSGIAVIIFSSQVKDFLGLKIDNLPADFIPKWIALFKGLPTFDLITFSVGLVTLLLILAIRKFYPKVPWGISSVALVTAVTWGFHLPVETILSRFGEIKPSLPSFSIPHSPISLANWHEWIADAITIAFLAGIEALLSAVVADGMKGTRFKGNCELMAQGVANIASVLFGGIPATGAIARTATNVKTGGKTPVAGMIHALVLLIIVLAFANIVSQVSLASLAAVLIMVSWNMSEIDHVRNLFRAPKSDIAILVITFLLTVFVDLTVAVEMGMILSLFLFMKRMSEVSKIEQVSSLKHPEKDPLFTALEKKEIPKGVEVYEIAGPFFFGITDRLKDVLSNVEMPPKVFILKMDSVPVIDASGMYALKQFHFRCKQTGTTLLFSGVKQPLHKTLKKFGIIDLVGEPCLFTTIEKALSHACLLTKRLPIV